MTTGKTMGDNYTPENTVHKAPPLLNGVLMNPRIDEGLRVELMTITPDLAAKWLKRNRINRPLLRRHVVNYVNAIKSGEWDDVNGETIIFSDENDLMDGQHRLTAVVEAQRPIVSLVVFGISTKKRGSIDTGSKRQLGHFLGMEGTKNATAVASTLRMLNAYTHGVLVNYPTGKPFDSYSEAQAFLAQHPTVPESVTVAKRIGKLTRLSYTGMLHYLFKQKDATLADIWALTLIDGHVREPYGVFLVLRERLISQLTIREKLHPLEQVVYHIKAFRAARKGETLKVFKWGDNEDIPEII